jgi:hypothetical protein
LAVYTLALSQQGLLSTTITKPIKQPPDVLVVLPAAMHLLYLYTKPQGLVKSSSAGHRHDFIFAFNLESSYVSKQHNVTK